MKIEGMRTPASALAYMEQFFEEYDWEAFTYAQTLSVGEMDELVTSLKANSADDKNTWLACYKAISVPFVGKLTGCKKILDSVIEEYQKDDLDAYSKFDAYKRIAAMIASAQNEIVAKLEKIIAKAAKYGACAEEVNGLKAGMDQIRSLAVPEVYTNMEQIPQIKTWIRENNEKIVARLAAKGIDAKAEYETAQKLMEEKRFVDALHILLSIKGYSDSKALIQKLDRYYLISDVLEIEGALFYFKKSDETNKTLSLHATKDGKISEKALIKNIGQIITNYADILYYLDGDGYLKQFHLSAVTETKLYDKKMSKGSCYVYDRKAYLLAEDKVKSDNAIWESESATKQDIIELDMVTGTVSILVENVKAIESMKGNQLVFTTAQESNSEANAVDLCRTDVINVQTKCAVDLGTRDLAVQWLEDDCVIYTSEAPNKYNQNLYFRSLQPNSEEKRIERNILKFCGVYAGKLFYYIGNSKNQSLISINRDGTGRKQWPPYIRDVLFEKGGWLSFIRRVEYNSILLKAPIQGERLVIIAANIKSFVSIQNGYLYYIDDENTLMKVRMDGSNQQALCDDVETVLSIREDKIVFISVDDRIVTSRFDQTSVRTVKSIYAVDFSGSGKIKLAYNVRDAKKYDEDLVYYVAAQETEDVDHLPHPQTDALYKLHTDKNRVKKLLDIQVEEEEKPISGFAIAMIVMATAFFFSLIGFSAEAIGLGIVSLLVGIIALLVGITLKFDKAT